MLDYKKILEDENDIARFEEIMKCIRAERIYEIFYDISGKADNCRCWKVTFIATPCRDSDGWKNKVAIIWHVVGTGKIYKLKNAYDEEEISLAEIDNIIISRSAA